MKIRFFPPSLLTSLSLWLLEILSLHMVKYTTGEERETLKKMHTPVYKLFKFIFQINSNGEPEHGDYAVRGPVLPPDCAFPVDG